MGDRAMPFAAISLREASFFAMPPPLPPSVNAGRTISGYPISSANLTAVPTSLATTDGITGWPILCMVSLKSFLSSALSMVSGDDPSRRTFIFLRKPARASCIQSVRPVWPPSPDKMLSGRSLSIMRLIVLSVSGSM
jgi:hypothetical protein